MDKMNKMNKMMLPLWVVGALLCLSINLSAQQFTPVGAEFNGQWTFKSAQTQERPMNTQDPYIAGTFSLADFSTLTYLWDLPTRIDFAADNIAVVETAMRGSRTVIPAYNLKDNVLEFVDHKPEITDEGDEIYVTSMTPFFNLTLNGNTMSIQCRYFYGTGEGNARTYTDGILTINYQR